MKLWGTNSSNVKQTVGMQIFRTNFKIFHSEQLCSTTISANTITVTAGHQHSSDQLTDDDI